jgi:hypothetical protein
MAQRLDKSEPLGAQPSTAYRMLLVAVNIDNALVLDIGDKPASDRALLAHGPDPAVEFPYSSRKPF